MNHISTGRAAAILGTTEPRLAELVRRGRIRPPPAVIAGRRLWGREHVLQAARHLGREAAWVERAYLEATEAVAEVRS